MSITVADGKFSVKNFLGEKGARVVNIMGDAKIHVDKEEINVSGANLEDVGQTAANIERSCKLKGRDRRIFQDGIYITGRHVQK
jgi:large subunit ribosomal protein L6